MPAEIEIEIGVGIGIGIGIDGKRHSAGNVHAQNVLTPSTAESPNRHAAHTPAASATAQADLWPRIPRYNQTETVWLPTSRSPAPYGS
ncbi:MAG: hypothetical protein PHG55_12440 [Verrucomicrobiota bacterium]|nr:hypothetical protein [Verrucomicrobiota bacterium]